MSFTQDELQALNSLFDQKMTVLRRDLDRSLDQRMQVLRREFEQRLTIVLQDLLRSFARRLSDQQHKSRDGLNHRLDLLSTRLTQTVSQEIDQRQQQQQPQLEDTVERALAAQLLAIEQLINQRLPTSSADFPFAYTPDQRSDFDAIEVQTEIPWEDLVELINKALDERLASLNDSFQSHFLDMEHTLELQLQQLRTDILQYQPAPQEDAATGQISSLRQVLSSIEQLEQLIESMQVAMTANSALLSNRLYHHQHLPLERAHPSPHVVASPEPSTARSHDPLSAQTEGEMS